MMRRPDRVCRVIAARGERTWVRRRRGIVHHADFMAYETLKNLGAQ
jgi:hypothetical protein